jgi:hypothetical protein
MGGWISRHHNNLRQFFAAQEHECVVYPILIGNALDIGIVRTPTQRSSMSTSTPPRFPPAPSGDSSSRPDCRNQLFANRCSALAFSSEDASCHGCLLSSPKLYHYRPPGLHSFGPLPRFLLQSHTWARCAAPATQSRLRRIERLPAIARTVNGSTAQWTWRLPRSVPRHIGLASRSRRVTRGGDAPAGTCQTAPAAPSSALQRRGPAARARGGRRGAAEFCAALDRYAERYGN